jgi:DNA invertase Pin-like site-specific DNA recombinase
MAGFRAVSKKSFLGILVRFPSGQHFAHRLSYNSGLREARRKGVKLGRPKGTTLDRKVFLQKHKDVLRQLKAGQSVRNAAKITGKGVSTVQRVKLALAV